MIFEGYPGGAQAETIRSGGGKVLSVGPLPANPQMAAANLLLVNSRYQQIPGLADWSIADLPGLVYSDYFHTPRSLVAPHKEGPADI